MNSLILLAVLSVSSSYGALLNSYLPPRGGAGSGAGLIPGPSGGGFPPGGPSYGGAPSGPVVPIISYENNPNQGDGTYSYSYQTGDGTAAQESGAVAGPDSGTAAQGSYSYTGPDGQQYAVTYTADANGFVPQGAHLPTPPPIPEAILQSLAFNAANPQSEFNDGGSGSYGAPPSGGRPGGSYLPPGRY